MSNVPNSLIPLAAALAVSLGACQSEESGENILVTDINSAEPADIETLPPDESVAPLPPEETGNGDDMVNAIDETENRS